MFDTFARTPAPIITHRAWALVTAIPRISAGGTMNSLVLMRIARWAPSTSGSYSMCHGRGSSVVLGRSLGSSFPDTIVAPHHGCSSIVCVDRCAVIIPVMSILTPSHSWCRNPPAVRASFAPSTMTTVRTRAVILVVPPLHIATHPIFFVWRRPPLAISALYAFCTATSVRAAMVYFVVPPVLPRSRAISVRASLTAMTHARMMRSLCDTRVQRIVPRNTTCHLGLH